MSWFPGAVVAGRGRRAGGRRDRPGDACAGGPAAAVLPLHAAGAPVLVDRLEQLAGRAGTRVVGVYEWALGDKSRRANAALTGLGATRRILVSDTMLADYSDDEIEVVLAHELGHHVHHDIWRGIALESALILLGFAVTDVVLRVAGSAPGRVVARRSGRDAAAGAGRRRGVAGADARRACAVATPRTPGRPVRAPADVQSRRPSSPRCVGSARRTLPRSGPRAWCNGCSTATRRWKSGSPSPAPGGSSNHRDTEVTETHGERFWIEHPVEALACVSRVSVSL